MEKQMKADREKRAMILTAEVPGAAIKHSGRGAKAAQILAAEGAKQAAILAAERPIGGLDRCALRVSAPRLQAQGQAGHQEGRFAAIKDWPAHQALATSLHEALPEMARGDANKVWVIAQLQRHCRVHQAAGQAG